MLTQCGKTGDNEGEAKEERKKYQRNLDQIICNDCGVNYHYAVNSECSTQENLKDYAEAISKIKQVNY